MGYWVPILKYLLVCKKNPPVVFLDKENWNSFIFITVI